MRTSKFGGFEFAGTERGSQSLWY